MVGILVKLAIAFGVIGFITIGTMNRPYVSFACLIASILVGLVAGLIYEQDMISSGQWPR